MKNSELLEKMLERNSVKSHFIFTFLETLGLHSNKIVLFLPKGHVIENHSVRFECNVDNDGNITIELQYVDDWYTVRTLKIAFSLTPEARQEYLMGFKEEVPLDEINYKGSTFTEKLVN